MLLVEPKEKYKNRIGFGLLDEMLKCLGFENQPL